MLNVAIAVDSATDYGPDAARVVATACEEVIGVDRCPLASDLQPGTVAAWYAVVHPGDRALGTIRIEFRDRTADGVLIEQRSLTFAARDSLKSRLASVGSVIAALAAAREGTLIVPSKPRSTEVPLEPSSAPTHSEASPADWSLDVAPLVAMPLGRGPVRFGGQGRVLVGLSEHPFVLVSGRFAAHAGEPSFSWWTIAIGAGTRLRDRAATLNFELRGEVVLEHTTLTAERGAEHDSASQNGWGGRLGVGMVWATWRHCSMIFDVDGAFVLPRINVVVAGEEAIGIPSGTLALSLGLRFLP